MTEVKQLLTSKLEDKTAVIGIIGLGSVGSMVAEALARMGMEKFVLIDFDKVEPHNLDRLVGATNDDIGSYKVDIAKRQINAVGTAQNTNRVGPHACITFTCLHPVQASLDYFLWIQSMPLRHKPRAET